MKYEITLGSDADEKYFLFYYPAGEMQVRLNPSELETIAKADSLVVNFYAKKYQLHESLMALALLCDALFHAGNFTKGAELYMPYLPYSRADRRFLDGDCFGLKVFSRMITDLGFNKVRTIDVHSPAAFKYLSLENIEPTKYIEHAIKEIGREDLTLLLPDKGAARYNLKQFGLPIAQADKIRDAETGKLLGFKVPELHGKVLIVDDICDGGGTFIGIADTMDKSFHPQTEKYLYVTHGIFSRGMTQLRASFKKIFTYKGEV